jgi:hypothetical protein
MSLLHGPRPKRDGASFILYKENKKTRVPVRLTERKVTGTEKAKATLEGLRSSLTLEEIDAGLDWTIRPLSPEARGRLAFGFRRH